MDLYTEINWKNEWFVTHRINWEDRNNVRKFFDKLAQRLKIEKPLDWSNISKRAIVHHNGRSLLETYGGSLFSALKVAYPGTENCIAP